MLKGHFLWVLPITGNCQNDDIVGQLPAREAATVEEHDRTSSKLEQVAPLDETAQFVLEETQTFNHHRAYNGGYTTSAPTPANCTEGANTAVTLVTDMLVYTSYTDYLRRLINRVIDRYRSSKRQYTHVAVNLTDVYHSVFDTIPDYFNYMNNLDRFDGYYIYSDHYNNYYYNYKSYYNNGIMDPLNITLLDKPQLLQGIKRALEVSPAGAVVLVMSSGLVADYDDTALLNDIYTLLDEKQSQVIIIANIVENNTLTESVLNDIASRSFGFYVPSILEFGKQIMDGMDLLLVTPLNCYVRVLEVTVNAREYVQEFNAAGYEYLMITSSGNLNVTLTDPNGNITKLQTYFYSVMDTCLIKYPASGIWRINITGNKLISLRILGFIGLNSSGNCSDIQCDPNASCEEYVGYKRQCVCKKGFFGNGLSCSDIDECAGSSWWRPYFYTTCVNTIGSYNVSCLSGYTYKENYGCIDIDECASGYPNDCHPLAGCTNLYGSYICYCPYEYFGDGKQCVKNDCHQSAPCGKNKECIQSLSSYVCKDPCTSYTNQTGGVSSATNRYYSYYKSPYPYGWYRMNGSAVQIPEYCVPSGTCGIDTPIWLNGAHPTIVDGIVSQTACVNWDNQCCRWTFPLSIKACPGGYYVYKLKGEGYYVFGYCAKSNYSCPGMSCFPDEECVGIDGGVSECQCSNAIYYNDGTEPSNPTELMSLECRLDQIKVTLRKCLLERMGYSRSSLHLRDGNCEGVIERTDSSYVAITMPVNSDCGAYHEVNQTHWTYRNVVYMSPESVDYIAVDYTVNVSCSYVINMETVLWLMANSFISEGNLTIGVSTIYPIRMGFFKDSSYVVLYEGPTVWLKNKTNLYVGISVQNRGNSQVVLVIRNCSATVISKNGTSSLYDIMKDYCPHINESTLSILENGVSSQARFQLQTLSKFGVYSKMYLHCQVHLCDTTVDVCNPICSGTNQTFTIEGAQTETITLGPILGIGNSFISFTFITYR
ncbi:uromodulin-like [Dendropsophus ebraccatus]|uniref:uromodulin-like n=1 Tax=Dendropsophus ebraccatus TaxID=150705 RepID=UPI003831BF98